jgi:hypothetical protein
MFRRLNGTGEARSRWGRTLLSSVPNRGRASGRTSLVQAGGGRSLRAHAHSTIAAT